MVLRRSSLAKRGSSSDWIAACGLINRKFATTRGLPDASERVQFECRVLWIGGLPAVNLRLALRALATRCPVGPARARNCFSHQA